MAGMGGGGRVLSMQWSVQDAGQWEPDRWLVVSVNGLFKGQVCHDK